jgi:uncharacterized protein (DUF1684 family)
MTQDHEHEHHEHEQEQEHEQEHEHHHDHGEEELDYAAQVEAFRADKDDAFRYSPGSPIPHEVRHDFPGLPYFPVDEELRFEGLALEPYAGDQPTSFQIPTSDNQLKPAHRAGSFVFELGGEPRRLTAYVIDGGHGESVFVPFLDATSGHETYGAGRYLDIEPEEDGTYALDFNLAYHPSCVYSPYYSCPITPAENRLPDRIEAGERLAEGDGEGAHV